MSDYRHPACLDNDTYAATKGVAMFRQRNCCVRKPIISLALRPVLSSSRSCRRPSRICFLFTVFSHPLLISRHDVVHTAAECVDALAVKRKCFPSYLSYQHCQCLPRAERASCTGPSGSLSLGRCLSHTAMLPDCAIPQAASTLRGPPGISHNGTVRGTRFRSTVAVYYACLKFSTRGPWCEFPRAADPYPLLDTSTPG